MVNSMKKSVLFLIIFCLIFSLGFGIKKNSEPNDYYEVYINDEYLGTIKSKKALENYIDKNGEIYKKKYNTDKVYSPSGLQIRKVLTYSNKVSSIKSVYKKIKKKSSFTVNGYQITINKKNDKKKKKKIKLYVLKESVFKKSIDTLIKTYVDNDKYEDYLNDSQAKIETTGETIENVYIDENITKKETKIPVDKKIYTSSDSLTKYLIYGDSTERTEYVVKSGDTIESVAFKNKINSSELLMSNSNLTSKNNLLFPGQKVKIEKTNPLVSVVEESFVVADTTNHYKTEEKHDDSILLGNEKVIQQGSDGLDRVSQDVKKVNGQIVYVNPKGKEVLKDPTNKIVLKGSKYVPDVGSGSYGWPTDSGWMISSGYIYRYSPVNGSRELHTGLDIAGTGYGSKIYATNNGRVMIAESHYSYGNYVVINHNNGYMTLYGHMSRIAAKVGQVVAKGDVIGYVGCTGSCTGPHVHYEVWKGSKYNHVNPSVLYPGGYR